MASPSSGDDRSYHDFHPSRSFFFRLDDNGEIGKHLLNDQLATIR